MLRIHATLMRQLKADPKLWRELVGNCEVGEDFW
jgi:hypothetical protein